MFRTKIDVDNHVRALFRNIKAENERNLRCYTIAKLYSSVGDYDSARHYICTYLSVKPDHAGAHKVLGQAYEGLKQKDKALEAYKRCLELESKQPDLVIKVCELLLATNPYLSPGVAQYWLERAQDIQANHPVVFSLKKHLLVNHGDGGSTKTDDLELLINKEIEVRPKDANLQIQLLKLYMETNRKDVAYKHAVGLEASGLFRQEILWYQCLSDVMKAYKESVPAAAENWEFHVNNVGVLLQQVALLSYQDTQHGPGHLQSLFDLDQALFEANEVLKIKKEKLLEECVHHTSSQLCLHLGIALLRSGKQSRLGWREYVKQAQPLLLLAAMPRIEVTPFVPKKEATKKRLKIWEMEKAYCCSQAGHVVLAMVKNAVSPFLKKINDFCCTGWREKLYQRIFSATAKQKDLSTSFFVQCDGFKDIPGSLPSPTTLMASDSLSQLMYPESLHHLVWLGLRNFAVGEKKSESRLDHGLVSPLSAFRLSRDFSCTVFENLQWSTGNLKWSGTESLSRLDVDAFLYASVYCAASSLKRQREKGYISEDRPPVLPADISDPLCSPEQSRWWNMAWQVHSGALSKSGSSPSFSEVRAQIQRGLEVIRVLGNHGLDVKLIVLLAKTFEEKASYMSGHESSKAAQLDSRAHLYWTTALALLERLDKNEMIHLADSRLFRFEGDELSRTDMKALLEEGRFFMACRQMRAEQYEEAALSFEQLSSPYASFYQALMYKKMADNVIGDIKNEHITSGMRSDHSILLLKARAALHLTLDRLRKPHMHPNHPLNSELGQHLDDVEGRLAHIELNMMNRNACDGTSDDSGSSHNSADEIGFQSTTMTSSVLQNGRGLSRSFQSSTPRSRRNDQPFSEKQEARPSPERLDAQIRHLTNTNDTLLQSVLKQNRAILASNKGILEALEKNQQAVQDMQTRISTLQNEMSKLKVSEAPATRTVMEEMQQQFAEIRNDIAKLKISDIRADIRADIRDDKDEELYVFNDDEELTAPQYSAPTYQNPYQPMATNGQGAAGVPGVRRGNVYPPHNFFPQTQVPVGVGRNVDPASMLYSQKLMYTALGLPFDGIQQTTQQAQVPDYSTAPTLVSLLYGNQQAAAATNVLRPQFTPVMPFGSPAVNLRPPTLPSTPVVPQPQPEVSTPRFGSDFAPHNYQISMPAQATKPSAASVEKNLSPSQPISTSALLKDVPSPMYSAVTTPAKPVKQSPAERQTRTSICSEDGSYVEETECEGDFKPLIPLPEEVVVSTGEENEIVLFDERAKLFRYVDGEWKERGIGQMKVLQHRDTKKSRIVMRREQVHKICANHVITEDINFTPHQGSETALLWVAQDYADEKVNLEKFCIRFKTAEQTARFRKVCEDAREMNKTLATSEAAVMSTSSTTTTPAPAAVAATTPSTPCFSFKAQPSGSLFSTPLQSMASFGSSPAAAKTPPNAGSGDDSYVEEYTPSGTFTPVIPLPDEVPVVTGEENETPLFSNRAKLYRFVDREWKDRGVGDIKILRHNETGKVRLVMRREQTLKVCANHFITADIELKPASAAGSKERWMWCAPDYAEEKVQNETFCVKFKTEDAAYQFKEAFDKARELSKAGTPAAETPTKPAVPVFGQPAVFGSASMGERISFGGFTLSSKPVLKPLEEINKSETESAPAPQAKPNPFSGLDFSSSTAPVFGSSKTDAMPPFSTLASNAKTSDAKEAVQTGSDQRPLSEIFKKKEGSWSCSGCYASNTADKTACVCCEMPKPGSETKPESKANVFAGTGFSFGVNQAAKPETSAAINQFAFGVTWKADTPVSTPSFVSPNAGATDTRPLSEIFKAKEGSWLCTACCISNTADTSACVCCTTLKPGSEATAQPEKPKSNDLSGGLQSKVDLSTGGQTFNFGIPASAPGNTVSSAPSAPSATFAFGTSSTMPAAAKKVHFHLSGGSFSLGMPKEDSKPEDKPKDAGFVFGSSNITAPAPAANNNPPAPFSFGSSSFAFNLQDVKSAESPRKSPGKSPSKDSTLGEEPESDDDEDHDHLQFKPVIPLPDKVAVVTGEEDEDVLFSHHAKLYRYADKEWKDRGVGDVKVLKHKTEGRLRLLMRRDQIHKICLNHFLTSDIEFKSRDAKSWTWSAPDFSERQVETLAFAIRFKDPDVASSFKSAIDKALVDYVSPSGKSKQADKDDKIPKEETTAGSKSGVVRALFKESDAASSGEDEVQIVYEATVTPEEREAALKLKLPANFYSYRRAQPCEGCRGCERDEVSSDEPSEPNPTKFGFAMAAGDAEEEGAVISKPVFNFGSFSSKPLFGTSTTAGSTASSIFGGSPVPTTTTSSIFGTPTIAPSKLVFGQTAAASPSVFGGSAVKIAQPVFTKPAVNLASAQTAPSINANSGPDSTKSAILTFGTAASSAPLFGKLASNAPSFGGLASNAPSFGGLASNTPSFGGFASNAPSFGGFASNAPSFGGLSSNAPSFGGLSSNAPSFGGLSSNAPSFGGSSSNAPSFGGSSSNAPSFGGLSSNAPSFGGLSSNAPSFGSLASNAPSFGSLVSNAPSFGSLAASAPTFGSVASSATLTFGSVTSSATPTSGSEDSSATPKSGAVASSATPTSGAVASSATPTSGAVASSATPTFGSAASSATPTFGSAASSATPTFGSVAPKEDEAIPFLPIDSSLSFAVLASNAKPIVQEEQDSSKDFKFAGAGAQVFGSTISETDRSKKKPSKKGDDGESSGDEGDTGHDDSHDPQFKPIIPLPDAIEVRTGEEDEIKLFCERAKVFRFTDKEWKERGVGEMKILYHPVRNSYRLLLRRDQVHKVVVNQPLTADLELSPMTTSETAWLWGGMNYAEEPEGNLEKLAVRFKYVEVAKNFKEVLESCQEKLRLNISASADHEETADVIQGSAVSPSDESNIGEDAEQKYDYYIDPSDVLCYESLFEETGALEENYDGTWKPLDQATIALVIDQSTGTGSIIVKKDDTVVCQTAQAEDDSYTVEGNCFEWTSFDMSTGSHRTLRISLPSEAAALDLKTKLDECVEPVDGEVEEEDEGEEEEEGDGDDGWQSED